VRSLLLAVFLSAATLAAADVSGKWRGSVVSTNEAGETRTNPAYLELKQEGTVVTGTAGPNESEPHQVKNGKFENNKLSFSVLAGETDMKIELTLEGDELKGQATRERDGQTRTAKLTLKREP
jgi:hypothetical protein